MSTLTFLAVRVLHIVLAAAWFGAVVFLVMFLTPAVQASGPAGGQVMTTLARRGLDKAMAAIAGTTVLSGIYLYWRFTGFDLAVMHGRAGLAFGLGGLAGIGALIVGGSIVGRGSKEMADLGARLARMPEGSERAAVMETMNRVRARTASGSRLMLALMTIALVLMTLGHYI